MNRKNLLEKLVSLYTPINSGTGEYEIVQEENVVFNWRNFTASISILIVMVAVLILPFFNVGKGNWLNLIVGMIFIELLLGLLAWLMIRLLGLIPDFGNPIWNHLLNLAVNSTIAFLVIVGVIASGKRKRQI